jgi:hypothetical protein
MLYYTMTLECPHCLHVWTSELVAEVEPPPDAVIRVRCPKDGGPIPVPFGCFKPTQPFPPNEHTYWYPPRPRLQPRRRWWQFWKS